MSERSLRPSSALARRMHSGVAVKLRVARVRLRYRDPRTLFDDVVAEVAYGTWIASLAAEIATPEARVDDAVLDALLVCPVLCKGLRQQCRASTDESVRHAALVAFAQALREQREATPLRSAFHLDNVPSLLPVTWDAATAATGPMRDPLPFKWNLYCRPTGSWKRALCVARGVLAESSRVRFHIQLNTAENEDLRTMTSSAVARLVERGGLPMPVARWLLQNMYLWIHVARSRPQHCKRCAQPDCGRWFYSESCEHDRSWAMLSMPLDLRSSQMKYWDTAGDAAGCALHSARAQRAHFCSSACHSTHERRVRGQLPLQSMVELESLHAPFWSAPTRSRTRQSHVLLAYGAALQRNELLVERLFEAARARAADPASIRIDTFYLTSAVGSGAALAATIQLVSALCADSLLLAISAHLAADGGYAARAYVLPGEERDWRHREGCGRHWSFALRKLSTQAAVAVLRGGATVPMATLLLTRLNERDHPLAKAARRNSLRLLRG